MVSLIFVLTSNVSKNCNMMLESVSSTFISASWIKPLWKKLNKLRGARKREIHAMGNDFGDPLTLARYYVQPHCQHHNPADYDENEPISFVQSPIFQTINQFLRGDFVVQGDGRNQMFILSDAGMGKTSLLLMLKLAHLMSFWPSDCECALIKLGIDSLTKIEALKNRSNTVLLLDALDEDPSAWGRIDDRIQELLSETSTFRRVIISCRTQFFPEDAGDPFGSPGRVRVAGFACPVLYLSLFDDEQVEVYLRKRFPKRWLSYFFTGKNDKVTRSRSIVTKMYSLRFRPLLLAHIDYIVEINENVWNDYTVYLSLVKSWLMREQRKYYAQHKITLSSEDLISACIIIAKHMSISNERAIAPEELKKLQLAHHVLKQLQHIDIGGRSLLNRRSDGAYRFSHYTIQEFLLVHGCIIENTMDRKHPLRITGQMFRFFVFAACTGITIDKALIQYFTSNTKDADLRGLDLTNLVLPMASLKRAKFSGATMEGAQLSDSDLSEAIFHRTNLQKANFTGANLSGADLREANCQGTNFANAKFAGADLRGGIFRNADFRLADLTDALVNPEDLIGAKTVVSAPRSMNNFTPRAQQVIYLARKEASRFSGNSIGTEFLMLGMIRLNEGVAINVLKNSGYDLEMIRRKIERRIRSRGPKILTKQVTYSPRVKKVLALAGKEANSLNHSYVGTEHILLGILREGEGIAARVLFDLRIDINDVRNCILKELGTNFNPSKIDEMS